MSAVALVLTTAPRASQDGEIVARGFHAPAGVAVDAAGHIVVADEKTGVVTEVRRDGTRTALLQRLDSPAGVAFDEDGGLLVVEEGAGRILRRDASGAVAIVASRLARPRWIAVARGGHVYVTSGQQRIVHVLPSGEWSVFADRLRGVDGVAVHGGALYAAVRRLQPDRGHDDTDVVRFPFRADGSAGPMEIVLRGRQQEPGALAVDRLGAIVATSHKDGRGHARGGLIKQTPAGEFATLASTLRSPQGVAFEPAGHLLVVEGEPARQIRRFRAPPPPAAAVPAFTNRSPVAVTGRTELAGLVRVFSEGASVAAATADPSTGVFALSLPLRPNQVTSAAFFVTADAGRGLTSAPAVFDIVHDTHRPLLSVAEPAPGLHTRADVPFSAKSEDEGSGVDSLGVAWDEDHVTTFVNSHPGQPLLVTSTLTTSSLDEGARTLTVTASDRAGNVASTALLVTVDRTPPETRIVSGPPLEIAEPAASVVVDAIDLLSPVAVFSWRLDGGPWSPFGPETTMSLTALTPGEHRFEVTSRDLAGNQDPTPAVHVFSVRSLKVQISEPAAGAVVTTGSLWVRGSVTGARGEASVTVQAPSDLGGTIAAPVEGGLFAVEVPADPAILPLTVTAVDASGGTAQVSVSVVLAPDGSEVQPLDVWPGGGLAPLAVRIGVDGLAGLPVTVDFEGDGVVDFEGEPADRGLYVTYNDPGVYVPLVQVTLPGGEVLTQRGVVEVYDPTVLDARLQAIWSGYKDSLRKGDIAAAVSFVAAERRDAWADYFASLPAGALEDVDMVFTAITLVDVGYGGAQYEMTAEHEGLLFSYPIWFQIDADGRWRLWRF